MDEVAMASFVAVVSLGALAFTSVRTAARNICREAWGAQARFRSRSAVATETAVLRTAMDAIAAQRRRGGRPLTLVEIGVSPKDFRRVSARSASIHNLVNQAASAMRQEELHCGGGQDEIRELSDIRVWLREASQVRPGHARLSSVDDGDRTTTFQKGDADTSFDAPRVRAILRSGNVTHELRGTTVFIGRAGSNGIVLHNPHLSAHHATITQTDGGWTVTDHSSNGTWVDGVRLRQSHLHRIIAGARLRLADQYFVFETTT